MFLIDTNVISEARKGRRADAGVQAIWADVTHRENPLLLSAITIGELRRGVELMRHRGDQMQARQLEDWLAAVMEAFSDRVLGLDLTLVTRNTRDFEGTNVELLNPFHTS